MCPCQGQGSGVRPSQRYIRPLRMGRDVAVTSRLAADCCATAPQPIGIPSRSMKRGLLLLCAVVSLSACGESMPTAAECQAPDITQETADACLEAARSAGREAFDAEKSATAAEPTEEAPVESGGPATEPASYPGGVTAQLISVEASPAEPWVAEDIPGHDTWVRIEMRLSSETELPLTVDPMGGTGARGVLLYGRNLTEANAWATEQETPTRITPDSPVTLIAEFSLPADGLEELVFVYTPETETEPTHRFTGVEQLLG